jgi:hypothetical protein
MAEKTIFPLEEEQPKPAGIENLPAAVQPNLMKMAASMQRFIQLMLDDVKLGGGQIPILQMLIDLQIATVKLNAVIDHLIAKGVAEDAAMCDLMREKFDAMIAAHGNTRIARAVGAGMINGKPKQ